MKIGTRITIIFTLMVSVLFFLYAGIIYWQLSADNSYVAAASGYDKQGAEFLTNLRKLLIIPGLSLIILFYLAGRFLSEKILSPISKMAQNAERIGATNLSLRLYRGKGKDELTQLSDIFNRLLDRLEASFESQKEFVSNIGHEIRTPLSAIIGEAEIAMSLEKKETEYRQTIKRIHEDAMRLSKITTGLLDLAKTSYDSSHISLNEVRLDEILLDARQDILKVSSDYNIKINIDENIDDESDITLKGNTYLLKVALSNLLENGCKFSQDKTVYTNIQYLQETKEVKLIIKDRGIGIPENDIPHIFESFYRGQNSNFSDGSGIGLSLVKKIIDLHKGKIKIDSTVGKGTCVEITLNTI